MSLGTYRWVNRAPGPGYGDEFDIDVDSLGQTNLPPNVVQPNLHIIPSGPKKGLVTRCEVPNFRIGTGGDGLVEGELYHSTNFTESDVEDS